MNISLLSGAYKNAGDFLIVDRCKKLLKYVYPQSTITEYERRKPLNDYIDTINKSDCLILAGGPVYVSNIYPNQIPLVEDLSRIKVPIFTVGLGWRGDSVTNSDIYNYTFSDKTTQLFKRIEKDGLPLSCRDYYTVRVLNNSGFKTAAMTGCPAWYNLEYIVGGGRKLRNNTICISDPAALSNFDKSITLINTLKHEFPDKDLLFVFHRGFQHDNFTGSSVSKKQISLKTKIEDLGIPIKDISYNHQGMEIYDNCFLHIGFRVHAHIYNLSQGNHSLLIEEDSRGLGVNNVFGLHGINVSKRRIFPNNTLYFLERAEEHFFHLKDKISNCYFDKELKDILKIYKSDRDFIYRNTFNLIKEVYFERMVEHIKAMEKHI